MVKIVKKNAETASAIDIADEEQPAVETTSKKRKGKTTNQAEPAAEIVEAPAEATRKKKKKKVQQDDGADENGKVDENDAPETEAPVKKKKKTSDNVSAQIEDCGQSGEVVEGKKKKQKKTTVEDENDATQVAEEQEDAVSNKKKKRKTSQNESVPPFDDEEQDKPKKKKTKLANEQGKDEPSDEKSADDKPKSGVSVFIGGIPWETPEETFRQDFEECGEIESVNFVRNPDTGLPKGIAFITFKDAAGAEAAIKYDGTDYGGRLLKVNMADSKNGKGKGGGKGLQDDRTFEVFVKNLNSHTDEPTLRKHFSDCGEMVKVSLPLRFTGKCKGFAWIIFGDEKAMEQAIALDGSDLGGFSIVVEKSGQHRSGDGKGKGKGKGKDKGKGKNGHEVFIQNLTYETTEAELREFLKPCGLIERMHMPIKGPEKKCMGFAWVIFDTNNALRGAIDRHGEEFNGRMIKIEKAGQHKDAPTE